MFDDSGVLQPVQNVIEKFQLVNTVLKVKNIVRNGYYEVSTLIVDGGFQIRVDFTNTNNSTIGWAENEECLVEFTLPGNKYIVGIRNKPVISINQVVDPVS